MFDPSVGHDNSTDGYVVSPQYMTTFTRKTFDPLAITVTDVCVEDIAHALAMQCRYNGHTIGHLSIARHSLWVSHEVALAFGHDPELEFIGLMHDAAEAYTGDFIRPIKHRPEMAEFKKLEARIERTIAEAFSFEFPHPEEIKAADVTITATRERHERGHWDTHWSQDEEAFLDLFATLQARRGWS